MLGFYEFFAGGGMARMGLAQGWRCLFANDIDEKKAAAYRINFNGAPELKVCDVATLTPDDLPGMADLAWASFPCQDLSLAGNRGGLGGERSGAFWSFWRLMQGLMEEDRAPRSIVLENVCGALTSHGGQDFVAIAEAFTQAGYRFGAIVIDAIHFLPQSRPRLFVIGVRAGMEIPRGVQNATPDQLWHSAAIRERVARFSLEAQRHWIWWRLPTPPPRAIVFADLIENEPKGVDWHTPQETHRLLSMMSRSIAPRYPWRKRPGGGWLVEFISAPDMECNALKCGLTMWRDACGRHRAAPVAKRILIVEGENIRSRLLSPREAARLMGLAGQL